MGAGPGLGAVSTRRPCSTVTATVSPGRKPAAASQRPRRRRRKVVILLLRVVVFITVSPVMAVCRVAFRLRQRAARCRRRPHLNLTEKPEPPLRWASGRGQRTDGDRHGGQPDHAATRPNEAADRTSARPRERARGGMAGEGGLHAPLAGPNEAPAAGEGAGGLRGGLEEVGEGGHGYTWKRDNWR